MSDDDEVNTPACTAWRATPERDAASVRMEIGYWRGNDFVIPGGIVMYAATPPPTEGPS